jgi:LemA protein
MMSIASIMTVIVLAGGCFYAISIYNQLVALKHRISNAFSQIEVQLKRRYDLIPNLVESVQSYLQHERQTLQAVVEARNAAVSVLEKAAKAPGNADALQQLMNCEGQLQNAMGRLSVVMEAYPDLKANQNLQQLTEELTATENKVAFARQAFNDAVMEYNVYKQSFPPVLLANFFGHRADAELLQFSDSELIQAAPRVRLSSE